MPASFQGASNFSISSSSFTSIAGSQHNYNLEGSTIQPDFDGLSQSTEGVQRKPKRYGRKSSAPSIQQPSCPAIGSSNTLGLEDSPTSSPAEHLLGSRPRRSSTMSSDDSTPPVSPRPPQENLRHYSLEAQAESRRQGSGSFSPASTKQGLLDTPPSTAGRPPFIPPPPPPPLVAPTARPIPAQQHSTFQTPPPPPPLPQKSATMPSGYTSSQLQTPPPTPYLQTLPSLLSTPPPSRASKPGVDNRPPPLPPRPYPSSQSSAGGTAPHPHASLPTSPTHSEVPIPHSPRVNNGNRASLSPTNWRRESLVPTQPTIPEEPGSSPWLDSGKMVTTPLPQTHQPLSPTHQPLSPTHQTLSPTHQPSTARYHNYHNSDANNTHYQYPPPTGPPRASTAPSPYGYPHAGTHTNDAYAYNMLNSSSIRRESYDRLWGSDSNSLPSPQTQTQIHFTSPQALQPPPSFRQPSTNFSTYSPGATTSLAPWVPHVPPTVTPGGNGYPPVAPPTLYTQRPPPGYPPGNSDNRRVTMPMPFFG